MRGRWKKEILLFVIGAVWGFIYWGNTVWNPAVPLARYKTYKIAA